MIGRLATPKLIGLVRSSGIHARPVMRPVSAAALTSRSRTFLTMAATAVERLGGDGDDVAHVQARISPAGASPIRVSARRPWPEAGRGGLHSTMASRFFRSFTDSSAMAAPPSLCLVVPSRSSNDRSRSTPQGGSACPRLRSSPMRPRPAAGGRSDAPSVLQAAAACLEAVWHGRSAGRVVQPV
jgi:hypothetical protein